MKTSNRALERMGIEQAEVVYCPVWLDVEVWYRDDCPLKVYIHNAGDGCHIGRSWFVEQKVPEDEVWDALVVACRELGPEAAFHLVLEYAEAVARSLEGTATQRSLVTAPGP